MPNTLWIHGRNRFVVGDAGFLVRISNATKGKERYELRDRPPHTGESLDPIPRGRCRARNDTTTDGLGVWRVLKAARNDRMEIQEITDQDELIVFLAEHGYPDLLDECLPATATT